MAKKSETKKTVLVIDDDPLVRQSLKKMLAEFNVRVSLACDANEALTKAVKADPDLIILDLLLPHNRGWSSSVGLSLLKTLKGARSPVNHVPVIVYSVVGVKMEDAQRLGADAALLKRNVDELRSTISRHLKKTTKKTPKKATKKAVKKTAKKKKAKKKKAKKKSTRK